MKPSGYTLHESADIAVIATLHTENEKTGDMVQVWILCRNVHPIDAVQTGADSIICGDCPHRGTLGKRTCYVNVVTAPGQVWRKYQAGGYPKLPLSRYSEVFGGRKIRFGAYGDPVLIPMRIIRKLAVVSDGWTGYTHQWRNSAYHAYAQYVMASVDSPSEYVVAKTAGWRTFRVRTADNALTHNEVVCPASAEGGHRTTCAECRLCAGNSKGESVKDVAIIVHGRNAAKFIQIGA